MMTMVLDIKRYIDDGGGFYIGNKELLDNWLATANEAINPLGLYIDESKLFNTVLTVKVSYRLIYILKKQIHITILTS